MRKLRTWLADEENHHGNSMVVMVVISHGNETKLFSVDGDGWEIKDLQGTLCDIEALMGCPKLLFLQACRGGNHHSLLTELLVATRNPTGRTSCL